MANNIVDPITIDVHNTKLVYTSCVQGEVNARFLKIYFTDYDSTYDLSGSFVTLYMQKTDGTTSFVDGTVNDTINGIATIPLTAEMSAIVGIFKMVIKIYSNNPVSEAKVIGLILEVKEGNTDDAIVSSNDFTALQSALATVGDYSGKVSGVKVNGNTLTQDSNHYVNVLCASVAQGVEADSAIQTVQVNGNSLVKDSNNAVNVLCATPTQGTKADSAIQGVQVNGADLTTDSNKKVNVTLTGLGGVSTSSVGVANGVVATNANNKAVQDPASYGTAGGAALFPLTLPSVGDILQMSTNGTVDSAALTINLTGVNFANYGGAYNVSKATKIGKFVFITGLVSSLSSSASSGTTMLHIGNSSFWPTNTHRYMAMANGSSITFAGIDVTNSGDIILQTSMTSTPWVWLNGIVYNVND